MYNPNKSKYFKQVGCNENEERDNYLIKVAAAVNDIGFINYKDAQNFSKTMTTNGLRINHGLVASFNNTAVDGFDTFNASTVNKLGFTQSTGFVSQLPTALNMSLDIRATKPILRRCKLESRLEEKHCNGNESNFLFGSFTSF